MTEYPERIWAAEDRQTHSTMWWPDDAGGVGVEYVRADRIKELEAQVAALRATLKVLDDQPTITVAEHVEICAFLGAHLPQAAAITKGQDDGNS